MSDSLDVRYLAYAKFYLKQTRVDLLTPRHQNELNSCVVMILSYFENPQYVLPMSLNIHVQKQVDRRYHMLLTNDISEEVLEKSRKIRKIRDACL